MSAPKVTISQNSNNKKKDKKKGPKVEVVVKENAPKAKRGPPKGARPKPKWNMRKPNTRVVTMEGFDYLGTVVVSPTTKIGEVLSIISICPTAWAGTRVQQEAFLWQRYRPRSLVLEITTSANKMMGGQYLAAWTADSEDPVPTQGEGALSKLMSYNPSRPANISSNLRMRIPISTTQKWYYLRGSEDKDVEYGKIFIAALSPLSNVSGSSKTTLIVRMRWTFDFSYPDLPSVSVPDEQIFASAPNYFSDSSSDWKEGKYLTFKWHEGGNIVEFPGAKSGTLYKIGAHAHVGYYISNGTIKNTEYAVCVTETTETGLPMLAPVKDKATGEAYIKNPSDTLLLSYFNAGPWVSPENPPWNPQEAKVQLMLCPHLDPVMSPMIPTPCRTTVQDVDTNVSTRNSNKLLQTVYGTRRGDNRDPLFGTQSEANANIVTLNETFNNILERGSIDPQDPQIGLFKQALEKLSRLSFDKNPLSDKLNVFNWDPLRGDDDGSIRSVSSSYDKCDDTVS